MTHITELGDLLLKLYFDANYSIEEIQREVNETIEIIKYGQKINENGHPQTKQQRSPRKRK